MTSGQIFSETLINVPKITQIVSANNSIENMFGFFNLMFKLAAFVFLLGEKRLKCVRGCVLNICFWHSSK